MFGREFCPQLGTSCLDFLGRTRVILLGAKLEKVAGEIFPIGPLHYVL